MSKPERIMHWHEEISSFLIANPGRGSITRAAEHFNVSVAWMSQIVNSDAFKAFWRARSDRHFEGLSDKVSTNVISIQDRLNGIADQALERVEEKLNKDPFIELKELRETSKLALNALGFTEKSAALQVNVQANTNVQVDPGAFERAQQRYREHQEKLAKALPAPEVGAVE